MDKPTVDKPEFAWVVFSETWIDGVFLVPQVSERVCRELGHSKFRITYNEAGEVVRLERVEE